jgi:hypothetical protein
MRERGGLRPSARWGRVPLKTSIGRRYDANAATILIVFDGSLDKSEKSEIFALSYAATGMKPIADLADQNIAGYDALAAKTLYAAALPIGIASISTGTLTLFMCHVCELQNAADRK